MAQQQNWKQRLFSWAFPGEIEKVGDVMEILQEAYRVGPAILSQETLTRNVMEMDSQLLDLVLQQRGWTVISGRPGAQTTPEFSEADRMRAVYESRWMSHYDVQTKRALTSWTDFGFGQNVTVVPDDATVKGLWDEFWSSRRNAPLLKQRKIQNLSITQLQDGEQFFVFYAGMDKKVTIRRFKTEDIIDIVYQGDDEDIPLFYVRDEEGRGRVLYPDWQASDEALDSYELKNGEMRADQLSPEIDMIITGTDTPAGLEKQRATQVKVLHSAVNENGGRGWPMFIGAFAWARAYKGFLEDRATVAKAVAATVDEYIHTAGSRANQAIIDTIASKLDRLTAVDNNPPQIAGSSMVHNKAVEVRRRPLTTGAGDAEIDGMTLLGQMSASDGLPLHWRGRPDAMQNRATAREQERPWQEQMQRYQTFWKDVLKDMVEIVAMLSGIEVTTDLDVTVIMQSPFIIDPDEFAAAVSAISDAAVAGTITFDVAQLANRVLLELFLTTYGVSDATDLIRDAEEKPEPTQPIEMAKRAMARMVSGEAEPVEVAEYLYSLFYEPADA